MIAQSQPLGVSSLTIKSLLIYRGLSLYISRVFIMNYIIIYWDSYGNAHHTERMDKQTAETTAGSMLPEQEPQIVFIN